MYHVLESHKVGMELGTPGYNARFKGRISLNSHKVNYLKVISKEIKRSKLHVVLFSEKTAVSPPQMLKFDLLMLISPLCL